MGNIKTVVKTINSTLAFVILSITSVNAYVSPEFQNLTNNVVVAVV